MALNRLEREEDGYFAEFDSQSGNGRYKTKFWISDKLAFKKGMITCNCKGWIFRRQCRHQDLLRDLLEKAKVRLVID